MSNLDELREQVLQALNRVPEESLSPHEEAADLIVYTLFSQYLEQETLKARIATATQIITSDVEIYSDTQGKPVKIVDYILELNDQLTANKSLDNV